MEPTTKQYTFCLFFNYGGEWSEEKAQRRREDALVYLKALFDNKAKFSCVAKDENRDSNCLLLRGYVNLNSPCTRTYAKRLLGKFSSCRPSYFGDVVSLCRMVHIDRNLVCTGKLPCVGNNSIKSLKPFATDPNFVVKLLLDSIDKKDFELRKGPRKGGKGVDDTDEKDNKKWHEGVGKKDDEKVNS